MKTKAVHYTYTGGDSTRRLNTREGYFPQKDTAADDLLAVLLLNHWVPLPKIMRLGIGCYGNVIGELRDLGWSIICRKSTIKKHGRNVIRSEYGLYRHVFEEASGKVQPRECGHKITDPKWENFRR